MSTPRTPLAGKTIAFVDDRYDINRYFFAAIRRAGAHLLHCNTLRQACSLFESREPIDAAVLDLHMSLPDPVPEALETFASIFRGNHSGYRLGVQELNAGQVLGMYLSAQNGVRHIPFIYLSAVADSFVAMEGARPWQDRSAFDKYETSPQDLVDLLEEMLRAAP
ncbi:hypothetical protein ACFOZ0_35560 [Streptomyces yaanensis]|uniref:Response regulatory domain-containing protein n=1 Tax=Streptomyces yaanensis TaxID=1142239 RepID=A0ABV7SND2_9ACTN|nr:hypothetical protein [Streptomyces sp. CGMCC 4.7035]WNB97198.1 hypothetical protein Q2K21_03435 [Streptomyces sp. CGMCC 4.7035]